MKIEEVCKRIVSDKDLKTTVAESYCKTITMIARDINEKNIKKLLNTYQKIDTYLTTKRNSKKQPLSINTKKTYYIALKVVAGIINCNAKAIKFYDDKMMEYAEQSKKTEGDNIVPEKFNGELPQWSEISDLYKLFTGGAKYGINHLLVGLYTLIPPRRGEYSTLVYLKQKPDVASGLQPRKRNKKYRDEKGIPYNYVYPDGDTYTMVLGSYKTNQTYGVYESKAPYQIPKALADIIKGYIKKSKVDDNELLMRTTTTPNSDGEYHAYKDGSFTSKISNAFKVKYTKHTLGVDNLRHMYLTTGVDLSKMTSNAKEALSTAMGHSITQQDRYRQISNEESNNDEEQQEEQQNETIEIEEEAGQCAECEAKEDEAEQAQPPAESREKVITAQDLLNAQYELVKIQIEYFKVKIAKLQNS